MRVGDAECPNCMEVWCSATHSYACEMRANVKLRARIAELEAKLDAARPVMQAAIKQASRSLRFADCPTEEQIQDALDEHNADCTVTEVRVDKMTPEQREEWR